MSTDAISEMLLAAGITGYVPHAGMTLRESLQADGVEIKMEGGYLIVSNYPLSMSAEMPHFNIDVATCAVSPVASKLGDEVDLP